MTGRYAAKTSVSPERSRQELNEMLRRYGAGGFAYVWQESGDEVIEFVMRRRRVRVVLPAVDDQPPRHTQRGRQQAEAQRWRALLLVVKAKLEAVESGITTFDAEFLGGMVLPNGRTFGEALESYPELLTAGPGLLLTDQSAGRS